MTDPIADYLTRLRNAVNANHRVVDIPASNIKHIPHSKSSNCEMKVSKRTFEHHQNEIIICQ